DSTSEALSPCAHVHSEVKASTLMRMVLFILVLFIIVFYITNTPPEPFSASTFSVCCGFAAVLYATAALLVFPLPSQGEGGWGGV
ncbi:MAG: hypothetical protein J5682_00370, partial [Prevotella sp.]|nr:hypothetical protein [Prevotella sp.]